MMSVITTYTGKHFDPTEPKAELIDFRDIAHALPHICRGNGQVSTFFSVGQHCLNCAKEALARGFSKRLALACLVHDASEAYMSDLPRPLKQVWPEYRKYEDRLLSVIYEKFLGSDLTEEEKVLLKRIDDDFLAHDLFNLLNEDVGELPKISIDFSYDFRPFFEVEKEMLELFRELNS
ncbi:MAG: hypothetical protein Q4C42_10695 [Clostridia bacterium]|nr:hypothetical protein [Clostridia bacterium]